MFTLAIFVEKKVYKDYKVEHASKHIPNKIWKLKNKNQIMFPTVSLCQAQPLLDTE